MTSEIRTSLGDAGTHVQKLTVAQKLDMIADLKDASLAFDGCHKFYVCLNSTDHREVEGYDMYPTAMIHELWAKCCGLEFVSHASFGSWPWVIRQGEWDEEQEALGNVWVDGVGWQAPSFDFGDQDLSNVSEQMETALYQPDVVIDVTYVTLEDSEVATLIDALAAYEQRLKDEGMTGKDARSALNKINSQMRSSTYGLRVTFLNY